MIKIKVSDSLADVFTRYGGGSLTPHKLGDGRDTTGSKFILFDDSNDEHSLRVHSFNEEIEISKFGKYWSMKTCGIVNGIRKVRFFIRDEEGWQLIGFDSAKSLDLVTF